MKRTKEFEEFVLESVEQELYEREISVEKRIALAKKGQAIPIKNKKGEIVDGRFPIENKEDFENAKKAWGRSKKYGVKAHIKKVAKKLGWTKDLPENW